VSSRAPLIMRPYDDEFLKCLRYLEVFSGASNEPITTGQAENADNLYGLVLFRVRKRAIPTLTVPAAANFKSSAGFSDITGLASVGAAEVTTDLVRLAFSKAGAWTAAGAYKMAWAASAAIKASAQL
jgi:hypothetical protein